MKEQQRVQQELIKKQIEGLNTADRIFRVFTVSGFGVYNCDSPHLYPKGANVNANFTDESGKPVKVLGYGVFYLVDRERNALFSYAENPCPKFEYNPDVKNIIWSVTPEKELLVFADDQFLSITSRSGPVTFRMKKYPESDVSSIEKIRSVLKIGELSASK